MRGLLIFLCSELLKRAKGNERKENYDDGDQRNPPTDTSRTRHLHLTLSLFSVWSSPLHRTCTYQTPGSMDKKIVKKSEREKNNGRNVCTQISFLVSSKAKNDEDVKFIMSGTCAYVKHTRSKREENNWDTVTKFQGRETEGKVWQGNEVNFLREGERLCLYGWRLMALF